MDRTERLYKIEKLLRQQQTVSFAALQAALEVSRATLKRDLDYLRTRLNAPIEWNRAAGGYAALCNSPSPVRSNRLWRWSTRSPAWR